MLYLLNRSPRCLSVTLCMSIFLIIGFPDSRADEPKYKGETRIYNTIRIKTAKPKIDGLLNDSCWLEGEWGENYRQNMPEEGAPPSQKTRIKILYDNENIYVAIQAFDNEPDKIDRQMVRRDDLSGDIVGVNFDSYFDHRTGFEFNMTASGSKIDLVLTNNGWDTNWNAVWDGKVGHEDSSWIAEMQIPLSQLRYGNNPQQVWGLHSWRWLNRNKEEDQWNLIPRDNAGVLYHFGELHGLENLPKVRRIEFMPYTVAKVKTYEQVKNNPFADGRDPSFALGLDGKFGIGSNFTVDYTVNPDFGQVEADPSELNLSAFETYYDEKRPFFMEGRNIFDFGFDDYQMLYSRRIGHSPTYEPETGTGEFTDKPESTSILGALKLTGKNEKGLSIGLLESLTSLEYVRISSPGEDYSRVSEPLTNYFAGRVQKDINKSNTIIGGIFTSTYRDLNHDYLLFMNKSAHTAGIDFRHHWKNKTYYIDFKAVGSHIAGSTEAITGMQKASSRYYQRPDAPHLELDTTATTLSGTGGSLEIGKGANGKWRYGIGAHWSSPGMELNDMGFQQSVDKILQGQSISYVENVPKGIFRTYQFVLTEANYWNFGGEFITTELEFEMSLGFENKWEFHGEIDRFGRGLDVGILRGGPALYVYGKTGQDYFLSSDGSKKVSFGIGYENELFDDGISNNHEFHTQINWKVTNSLQISPEFTYFKEVFDYQYIPNKQFSDPGRFLLGHLNRNTYGITLRLSYAVTPDFTIQYYGSPYITMGKFSDFKTLADPDAKDPSKVLRSFNSDEIAYDQNERKYIVNDGVLPELSFDNPDFNFRQLRSNLVARWEYRPGSVLYLVWTHNRTSSEDVTNNSFDYNMDRLFNKHAENVFLLKFSYWFSL
jgi:hypothetical protein